MLSLTSFSHVVAIFLNKTDEEDNREVKYEEGENFAKLNNLEFAETSSKLNINIAKSFINLTSKIIEDGCFEQRNSITLSWDKDKSKDSFGTQVGVKKGCC